MIFEASNHFLNDRLYDLVVIGEINPDLILTGDVHPEYGQTEKVIDNATLTIGSSSCIFACAAVRLGLRTAFIGKVGEDEFGHFMLRQLETYGIDTRGVVIDSHIKTGISVIFSKGNDRAILTYPGTIGELYYEEIDLAILKNARHLHLGSYFMLAKLQPHIPILFKEAQRLGLSTSLDTNYDPLERWSDELFFTLDHTNIFLPNEKELFAITRRKTEEEAFQALTNEKRLVVVKKGANGCAAAWQDRRYYAPALPVQVQDTTGAGDTFDAGLVAGLLRGWDLEKALRFACICGSLSTRSVGGTEAQPTMEEALRYL